jgi:hypothetical protein
LPVNLSARIDLSRSFPAVGHQFLEQAPPSKQSHYFEIFVVKRLVAGDLLSLVSLEVAYLMV